MSREARKLKKMYKLIYLTFFKCSKVFSEFQIGHKKLRIKCRVSEILAVFQFLQYLMTNKKNIQISLNPRSLSHVGKMSYLSFRSRFTSNFFVFYPGVFAACHTVVGNNILFLISCVFLRNRAPKSERLHEPNKCLSIKQKIRWLIHLAESRATQRLSFDATEEFLKRCLRICLHRFCSLSLSLSIFFIPTLRSLIVDGAERTSGAMLPRSTCYDCSPVCIHTVNRCVQLRSRNVKVHSQ